MRGLGVWLAAVAVAAIGGGAWAEAGAAGACGHDREALLALDVRTFDKTRGAGWRLVGNRRGCEAAAADLIRDYRLANAGKLVEGPVDDLRGLLRHESQLRAAAGQEEAAVRLREHARYGGDRPDQLYDDATIAFLKKDRAKLQAARAELAGLPKPAWFEAAAASATAQHGLTVTWPPNLDVVDGLIACFDRPYAEAYSLSCREPVAAGEAGSRPPAPGSR